MFYPQWAPSGVQISSRGICLAGKTTPLFEAMWLCLCKAWLLMWIRPLNNSKLGSNANSVHCECHYLCMRIPSHFLARGSIDILLHCCPWIVGICSVSAGSGAVLAQRCFGMPSFLECFSLRVACNIHALERHTSHGNRVFLQKKTKCIQSVPTLRAVDAILQLIWR